MPLLRSLTLTAALGLALLPALPASAQERGLAGPYLAARHASLFSDFKAAAEYYTRALARDGQNPQLLENAILANIGLGQVGRAVPVSQRVMQLGMESQIAQMVLLADQLEREAYQAALDDLANGRSVGPLVDGLIAAWSQLALGDMEAAAAAFDATIEETGLRPMGLFHKGLAYAVAGDYAAADEVFSGRADGALRLTFRGVIAHAQILSQLDRNADAIELITTSFGTNQDPGLTKLLADLEAGTKLPFDLLSTPKDGLADVFYTVARALEGEASANYTLLYARMAEHLRPGHTDAILLSAGLLEQMEQYELANVAYDSVPRDDPSYANAELGRAGVLGADGKTDAAIEVLQQLTETHGDLSAVHVTLGDALRREERYSEATEAYDAGIALLGEEAPTHWVVYFARGITHEREKRWPEAEADFRTALRLNPDQPRVLNYLGYSFLEMDTNLEEALDMIERAVKARPDDGYIIDSLGWGLYRLGRYEEAVGHMEKAVEKMPIDPIVNDHLGDVYWAVGRKLEAQFQWHRALSFDPEEDEADRIRRKLEVGLDKVLEEEGEEPLSVANDDG